MKIDRNLLFAAPLAILPCFALASFAQAPNTPAALPDAPSATAQLAPAATPTGPTVLFDTSMGRLACQLFDQEAPQTSANFIGLATGTKPWTDPATHTPMKNKPFYNGTQFHRVIPGFMIQGGDPLADGTGDAGYFIPDEISPSLRFDVPGRLAMANGGPNTNSSQFFITEVPKPELNGHYSIFGQCDPHSVLIVASIARVERNSQDKPYVPVTLNKVTVLQPGQPVPPEPALPAPAVPQTAHPPQP
ncbi:MAG TPA: peptidylprolyl isomerase [Acidobacteriaceae bacterium]|nr:peptidylprolyl isomerase [Acidobacteriaceae bacterium]